MADNKALTKERRSAERKNVALPGRLIFDKGSEDCTVYDISPRGANVTASEKVPSNRPITLKLTAHGEFIGKVVWRNGDRVGLEFLHLSDDPTLLQELHEAAAGPNVRLVS
jgi:hypothetical protein